MDIRQIAVAGRVREVNGYGSAWAGVDPVMYIPPIVRTTLFEPRRDLIGSVSNAWDGAAVSSCAYANDALGRRMLRIDTTPALSITNAFDYNLRSEVTNAVMGANAYGYDYDPIGSRIVTTENTETTEYFANALNQYTNILCVPASLRLDYDPDGVQKGSYFDIRQIAVEPLRGGSGFGKVTSWQGN